MGLMQRAYETYCMLEQKYCGVYDATQKEPLAPVSHLLTAAELEITVDRDGGFVSASAVGKEEGKILIPVTEASAGRTSAPTAHPLCDNLAYLSPMDEEKNKLYIEQLQNWADSEFTHPKLKPILHYIKGGTILSDLKQYGIIKVDENGKPEKEKAFIRWRVLDDSDTPECWKDKSLFDTFIRYYRSVRPDERELCMVTGEETAIATQHPKGTIAKYGNAKLISANDSSGFTYRGRFTEDWQAASVGYEASQKAHAALRWLAANQGIMEGGRTFLCWTPQGIKIPRPNTSLLGGMKKELRKPSDYQKELQGTILGLKKQLPASASAVLATFDAATTGRLALTYYSEMPAADFLDRIGKWDATCCWYYRYDKEYLVESPNLLRIVDFAFGVPRSQKEQGKEKVQYETPEKVVGQQLQRLISCRVDGAKLSADFAAALFHRASNLQILSDSVSRELMLFTACAVIRKYHYDRNGEVIQMALEPEKKDRSYQFGRLLAILEKAENDTYQTGETRETNAMRLQSRYTQQPMRTFSTLVQQVKNAYFKQLKPGSRVYYENLISKIIEILSKFPEEERNRPLSDMYLFGYYLQRAELYKKSAKTENEEGEMEDGNPEE